LVYGYRVEPGYYYSKVLEVMTENIEPGKIELLLTLYRKNIILKRFLAKS